jgi:hypothetical protein
VARGEDAGQGKVWQMDLWQYVSVVVVESTERFIAEAAVWPKLVGGYYC